MPVLHHGRVFRMRKQNEALNHSPADEGAGGDERLPSGDGQPTGQVPEELSGRRGRQHRNPMVLPA